MKMEADNISYFSMYALQHFYLPSPVHSQFINQKVLERYLPVGGVRIEDDILITSRGYENLTTAPKGKAMLDIIRGTESSITPRSTKASGKTLDRPVFRAPGIPLHSTPAGLHQMGRALTMPNQLMQGQYREEPSSRQKRSLGFRRSMTTDERVQYWRESCRSLPQSESSPAEIQRPATVCGSQSTESKHTYLGEARSFPCEIQQLPNCTQCMLLVHALDRLRQNLNRSEQGSPKSSEASYQKPTLVKQSIPLHQAAPDEQKLHDSGNPQDPETFYRPASLHQTATSLAHIGLTTESLSSNSVDLHSQSAIPSRAAKPLTQEQRRLSNHTDDRDWMA